MAHNDKWILTREARKVNECKLCKIKFAKAEDLVAHYEKDIKHRKNEHN